MNKVVFEEVSQEKLEQCLTESRHTGCGHTALQVDALNPDVAMRALVNKHSPIIPFLAIMALTAVIRLPVRG